MAKKTTTKKTAAKKAASNRSSKKAEIQSQKSDELAQAGIDFAEDAGMGSENMTKDDMTIPRLRILQALSPQAKKRDEAYVEGAEEGMIIDSVSLNLFDGEDGITVIPISYSHHYVEWQDRSEGGGFVADHGTDDSAFRNAAVNKRGQHVTEDGNMIVPTAEYFVFLYDEEDGSFSPFVISMSGSQKKHSRRWNTIMNTYRVPHPAGGTFNPAMFYRSYKLTTAPESNDQGSWFGWSIEPSDDTINLEGGKEIYLAARDFLKQVKDGAVKAAQDSAEVSSNDDDDNDDAF